MRKAFIFTVTLPALLVQSAFGFSSDNSSLSRSYSQTFALTNSPILVMATFTNGGSNPLRGFFFGEQVPAPLKLTPISVTLNGQTLPNVIIESGLPGDVLAGCTPWRWRLETPTNFAELNPVPAQTVVQINYALSSALPGTYSLPQFDWAGEWPSTTNASFGYSDAVEQVTLNFLVSTNPPVLAAQFASTGVEVLLAGSPGVSYLLESAAGFGGWWPVLTNAGSFSFIDTNVVNSDVRLYRGRIWLGGP